MNSNELYNELKQLTKLGYLEQAQLERIQDEYMISRKEHQRLSDIRPHRRGLHRCRSHIHVCL